MKQLKYIFGSLAVVGLFGLTGCSDFDDVNVNPNDTTEEQILTEYLVNKSIVQAQLDPDVSERSFVLYWKDAAQMQRSESGFQTGRSDDGWTSNYYGNATVNCLKPINLAIQHADKLIQSGTFRPAEKTMREAARVWRVYLLSELTDCFGPVSIGDYSSGKDPVYSSTEEVYMYMLKELKEAAEALKSSPEVSDKDISALDKAYGFNPAKWRKYANSMRMRLAMRLSEVKPDVARSNFEEAAAAGGILEATDRFQIIMRDEWAPLVNVMSRQWNTQYVSPVISNLTIGLGGVNSKESLPAKLHEYVKEENYAGMRLEQHLSTLTTSPLSEYFLDGLPAIMDPRTYKLFPIPGDFDNPDFCYFPSWADKYSKTTKRPLKDPNNPDKDLMELDAKYTWNIFPGGSYGKKGDLNRLMDYIGPEPRLGMTYREGYKNEAHKYRIFFAEWETNFLLAEASVRGWKVPKDGKNAYEDGIKQSFAFVGADHVDKYLKSTSYNRVGTSVSWDHVQEPQGTVKMNYVDGYTKAPGTIDYHYPELANRLYTAAYNDRLTKIITQKFIANTPWLPLEAWSDHRRLGLPFFNTPVIEKSIALMPQLTQSNYKVAQVNFFPQRIPYPSSIKNGNPQGYNGAVQKLGGKDEVFTPLWWAKKK